MGGMTPPGRILFDEWGTQLRLADDDALMLNVLCGRVGLFGVEFALNEQERDSYRLRGDSFIKELSRKVRDNWEPYARRGRAS
jgi:hypothetical protein